MLPASSRGRPTQHRSKFIGTGWRPGVDVPTEDDMVPTGWYDLLSASETKTWEGRDARKKRFSVHCNGKMAIVGLGGGGWGRGAASWKRGMGRPGANTRRPPGSPPDQDYPDQ